MKYWRVRLGRLDKVNLSATYSFPNKAAAMLFAQGQHASYPNRAVAVSSPAGVVVKRWGPALKKRAA